MGKSKRVKQSHKPNSVLNKRTFKAGKPLKSKSTLPKQVTDKKNVSKTPAGNSKDTAVKDAEIPKTTIPFSVYDRILLVGDGDFSFAAALVTHHGVADIWATSYDSQEECYDKYPETAKANVSLIQEAFEEPQEDDADDADDTVPGGKASSPSRILFNIDATSLKKNSTIRQLAPFHRIIFNFPHVGGITTDVNRQVRANQKLLSEFFHAAIPLLASSTNSRNNHTDDESTPGSVIVTLFEGEPYTLWNPRDLARHAGMTVWRSWKFEPRAFPGYRHGRTAGTIRRKDTGDVSETAWRGEDRLARVYEFGIGPAPGESVGRKKRKGKHADSSDDE
jgi:25S rRNA (uracil2634-N3)-methyltransferase